MIQTKDRLALGVCALRELTGEPADGRACRARVLVRAAWRAQHRRKFRIAGLLCSLYWRFRVGYKLSDRTSLQAPCKARTSVDFREDERRKRAVLRIAG
jgi:hypothetical protein